MLNKKSGVFVFVFLAVTGVLVFVFLYFKYREEKPVQAPEQFSSNKTEPAKKTCPAMVTTIVDGILKQIDGDFLYVTSKESSEPKVINLTSKTKLLELSILQNNEGVFNEKQINRDNLKQGDQLSVVVFSEKENFANNTAVAVRRMVIQGQEL